MVFDPKRPARGYALTWPRALFRDELRAVLSQVARGPQLGEALGLLFVEALRGPDPVEDLASPPSTYYDADGSSTRVASPVHEFGVRLLQHVDALPVYTPRRYYLARQSASVAPPETPSATVDWVALQGAWSDMVNDLVERGYLDRLAGNSCSDGQGADEQAARISRLIFEHCQLGGQWPLTLVDDGVATDEDLFFTLVEVFHDLVARPRVRDWHSFDEAFCWYSEFNEHAGQAVYRWKVNELLARYAVAYQLAESGEDQGLLVRRTLDPRQELMTRVTAQVPDRNRGLVDHAIAQFRRRGATLEEKRSACTALAHVLEDRTPLITKLMNNKDESDLFNIANNFAIRHQNAKQRTDYAEEYLDWIFWWYLATVELTNRLLARNETSGG